MCNFSDLNPKIQNNPDSVSDQKYACLMCRKSEFVYLNGWFYFTIVKKELDIVRVDLWHSWNKLSDMAVEEWCQTGFINERGLCVDHIY